MVCECSFLCDSHNPGADGGSHGRQPSMLLATLPLEDKARSHISYILSYIICLVIHHISCHTSYILSCIIFASLDLCCECGKWSLCGLCERRRSPCLECCSCIGMFGMSSMSGKCPKTCPKCPTRAQVICEKNSTEC